MGVSLIQIGVASLNREFTAEGHRVAGVHSQVHDDLLNLPGVCFDPPQSRFKNCEQDDVFSNQPPQHVLQIGDGHVEVKHLRSKHLAAAESQQLAGERGGTLAGTMDFFDVTAQRWVRGKFVQKEFRVSINDGQQVVEIVSHTARQAPHGLDLGRLLKL